jgi:anaerobic ribonucleoside-triphosphate reductase activating protein
MKNEQFLQPTMDLLEIPPGYVNLMDYIAESETHGPGCRAVVFVQGCLRHCHQCADPQSWSFEINELISTQNLTQKILSNPRHTGVTFSGGEPFWQAPTLAVVARQVKAAGLSVMAFTGFTLAELHNPYGPAGAEELLAELDILIDGPYIESLAVNSPNSLISSSNQEVHIFNSEFKDQLQ